MKALLPILTTLLLLPLAAPAEATVLLQKEGVIGATTGGLAGGIIGHQSGHTTEGAILGSVAGYAIGTTIHRQKQRGKQLERERALMRQRSHAPEEARGAEAPPEPTPPAYPRLTSSEQQQLLLQAAPLFSVKRTE